jgi:hypothetical protein
MHQNVLTSQRRRQVYHALTLGAFSLDRHSCVDASQH